MNIIYAKPFSQDGADFYDDITGELIASYPKLVKNDSDLDGAYNAKFSFLKDNPEYLDQVTD